MNLAVLLVAAIACQMVVAQQYTNVLYIGVQSATGSYGATNYVNVCTTLPSLVRTNFPLCKDGMPLAGLRVGTNVTSFSERIGTGSIVGPTGKLIAQTFSQFLSEPLNQSLSQAGVSCATFFSNANPSTGLVPNGMNDGCALGLGNSLGSNSALRSYFQGNCTSTAAMTWYSGTTMPTCSVSTSLLCFCTSLNAPTSSPTLPTALPSKSPTASPSRTPSRAPVLSPSRSPTPSTGQPTPLPTSQKPSLTPTSSPTFRPTFSKPTITNVVYMATSSAELSIGASNFVDSCANNIPANVLLNFPGCSNGVPLASLRIGGTTSHFLYRIDSGQIVGPNGFVIADNATQFFNKTLRMTLSAAEVGCSNFFSGSLATGLGNTGTNECATSTSGDFLSTKSESYSYRRGSCTSSAIGWFTSSSSTKCESKTSFLCVCRVLVTDSPVPAPSTAPAPPTPPTATPSSSPITKSPTIAPTNPTGAPTKLPTTLAPTKRPSTQAPTYGPAEYSVIYVGTTNVKGNYGVSNYAQTCRNVPDAVYQQFPDCTGGAPFASLRIGGATTHLTSRITTGAVYGPNGALIAASPSEFYNGPLTASLASAGVSCTTFFSGSLSSGLANTGTTECSKSSTGDFLADDDDKYSYHIGSCTSRNATWFSTATSDCDKATTFLCYCQVHTIEQSSSPTVSNALGSSSNQGTSEVVTIVAWGLVGILAAMVAVAGGVFYVRRVQKPRMGTPGAHIQMTTASIRNSERLIPPPTALSARMPGDIEETKMNN